MLLSVAKEICAMGESEIEQTFINSGEYMGPKGWIEEITEIDIRQFDVKFTVLIEDDGSFNGDESRVAPVYISKKVNGQFHGTF